MSDPLHAQSLHARARRVRRLRRWAVGVGLGVAAAITVGWIVVGSMLRAAPPWWRQVRLQEQRTHEIATEVENAIGTHLHLAREGEKKPDGVWRSEPWGVSIPSSDANAWLNARLPKWLETMDAGFELPRLVSEVQVEFRDGRISIGGASAGSGEKGGGGEGERRILWASASATVEPGGALVVVLDRVYVGRLPISRGVLVQVVERTGLGKGEGSEAWKELLRGREVRVEPVMKLEDGRRVRVKGLRAREGKLEVTCVTEHGVG
ncbi:MAG: hypothetical protein KF902_14925 [Phycisphaeraceae bacterium]|nr:hypothetical protein [Phycisphaeraceae bacterium]MCW5768989.1 hypothetical protein [Phycisphaeraceae bacterium]